MADPHKTDGRTLDEPTSSIQPEGSSFCPQSAIRRYIGEPANQWLPFVWSSAGDGKRPLDRTWILKQDVGARRRRLCGLIIGCLESVGKPIQTMIGLVSRNCGRATRSLANAFTRRGVLRFENPSRSGDRSLAEDPVPDGFLSPSLGPSVMAGIREGADCQFAAACFDTRFQILKQRLDDRRGYVFLVVKMPKTCGHGGMEMRRRPDRGNGHTGGETLRDDGGKIVDCRRPEGKPR